MAINIIRQVKALKDANINIFIAICLYTRNIKIKDWIIHFIDKVLVSFRLNMYWITINQSVKRAGNTSLLGYVFKKNYHWNFWKLTKLNTNVDHDKHLQGVGV